MSAPRPPPCGDRPPGFSRKVAEPHFLENPGGATPQALAGGATAARELSARELIEALHALREAPGSPDYWTRLATGLMRLTRAQAAWLLRSPGQNHTDNDSADWQILGAAQTAANAAANTAAKPTAGAGADPLHPDFRAELQTLTERAATQGFASCPGRSASGAALWWAAVRLEQIAGGWLLLAIPDHERPQLNELLLRAQLVADLPTLDGPATARRSGPGSGSDHGDAAAAPAGSSEPLTPELWLRLAEVCEHVAQQDRFGPAALALVNALAAQTGAGQVVLGWRYGDHMRVVAISHRDRFDHFSRPIQLTEDALDEALDQDGGVRLAATDRAGASRWPAHGALRESLANTNPDTYPQSHLMSLPLRREDSPACAVLLLAFDEDHEPDERLAAMLVRSLQTLLPWLQSLHTRSRAWPLRLKDQARGQLAQWLGPGRVGVKIFSLLAAGLLLYALFAKWDYRVNANGALATDSTRLISAQFDARIDDARVSAGENVRAGDLLALLDTRELRQQETDARAELQRFTAEADKARAAGALAETEVASARAGQAQARLSRVIDQLAQAEHRAPFDGVVVEGERKELQGAPARKGDKLYRLARVEGLYATLQVPERDAALVQAGATGELVLVSRPDEKIPLRVLSVIPVAQTRGAEGNYFLVRAELLQAPQTWWRPGMSGAVRIDAGERQVAWILTHRLVDTARLALWW